MLSFRTATFRSKGHGRTRLAGSVEAQHEDPHLLVAEQLACAHSIVSDTRAFRAKSKRGGPSAFDKEAPISADQNVVHSNKRARQAIISQKRRVKSLRESMFEIVVKVSELALTD